MKLADYIDTAKLAQHIKDGYVMERHHNTWPLVLYCYTRRTTYDNVWDEVTTKTRSLIVNKDTGEIVARSFEKFFNYGDSSRAETWPENLPKGEPAITKKLDGNLITLYPWEGRWYAASKGSFHSEHADWANDWLANKPNYWPIGWTPVLEMVAEDVQHHVVHYGAGNQGLTLLSLIDNETGEEGSWYFTNKKAELNGVKWAEPLDVRMECALKENNKNEEGYVLAWPRAGQPPFRVKVKFVEFLRLQKLLHNTGPKQILDMLRHDHLKCYLDEALDPERSTPEFVEWVQGWVDRLKAEYARHDKATMEIFDRVHVEVNKLVECDERKSYALRFTAPQCRPYAPVLFSILDGDFEKSAKQIWKLVEPMTEGNRPFTTEEE